MTLDKNAKIYVAGHHGLVGSAIWNNLLKRGYTNLVPLHSNPDLTTSWLSWHNVTGDRQVTFLLCASVSSSIKWK